MPILVFTLSEAIQPIGGYAIESVKHSCLNDRPNRYLSPKLHCRCLLAGQG